MSCKCRVAGAVCTVVAFVVLTFTFTYIPNMVKKHVNIQLSERIIAQ